MAIEKECPYKKTIKTEKKGDITAIVENFSKCSPNCMALKPNGYCAIVGQGFAKSERTDNK